MIAMTYIYTYIKSHIHHIFTVYSHISIIYSPSIYIYIYIYIYKCAGQHALEQKCIEAVQPAKDQVLYQVPIRTEQVNDLNILHLDSAVSCNSETNMTNLTLAMKA